MSNIPLRITDITSTSRCSRRMEDLANPHPVNSLLFLSTLVPCGWRGAAGGRGEMGATGMTLEALADAKMQICYCDKSDCQADIQSML